MGGTLGVVTLWGSLARRSGEIGVARIGDLDGLVRRSCGNTRSQLALEKVAGAVQASRCLALTVTVTVPVGVPAPAPEGDSVHWTVTVSPGSDGLRVVRRDVDRGIGLVHCMRERRDVLPVKFWSPL